MKFELTKAAINHGIIATAISLTAAVFGLVLNGMENSPVLLLLMLAGSLKYLGREIGDIQKIYNGSIFEQPNGAHWNSAELLMPIMCNVAMIAFAWGANT